MIFIDTHSHIYLEDFKQDIEAVILRAKQNGVKKIFMPAISKKENSLMIDLKNLYSDVVFLMAGLHPSSVSENYTDELAFVEKQLDQYSFSAIGEIGLDFYWDVTYKDFQYKAFEQQMQWALERDLPIVIHTRNAMQETINCVQPFAGKGLKGIFHCFGDSYENAEKIIDMGFLLGIGGVVTYKKSGLADVIKKLSLNNIVLETDAPYLTPVPFRGKRNESAYVKIIAEKIAEIKQISIEEVAAATTANAEKLFATNY